MGFIRSEDMHLYKFMVTKDAAYQAIRNFGKTSAVHFLDMNKYEQSFKLPYTEMVKRCEETEKRLLQLTHESARYRVAMIAPQTFDQLEQALQVLARDRRKNIGMLFDEVEHEVQDKFEFLTSQNERIKTMHEVLNELLEYRIVLMKSNVLIHGKMRAISDSIHSLVSEHDGAQSARNSMRGSIGGRLQSLGGSPEMEELKEMPHARQNPFDSSFREISIRYVAGTINQEETMRFKRLLFRASRGKVLSYFEDIETPLTDFSGKAMQKCVYVLVFEEGTHLREKITKICDSFQGKRFHLPDDGHADKKAFQRKIDALQKKIDETQQIIKVTKRQMRSYLEEINSYQGVAFALFEVYRLFILKEKMVYKTLNMLQKEGAFFEGYLWSHFEQHQLKAELLRVANEFSQYDQFALKIEEVSNHKIKPPTFIKTNAFTQVYQDIVDTYGIPLYKEVNPALFTCVTFPFLFGIMFGDIGHGSVLLIVGVLLCLFDTCLRPRLPALSGLFKIRYLLLLMGLFSTFSGFLYNDFMSIPLFLRDSCYDLKTGAKLKGNKDCIYPFGIDPIWYLAKNELSFFNSFKMKLAVILGVLQMSLGVCMKAVNSIYFKRWLDLYHEFIPQIVLLWVLFGYMDVLIILKWLTNYEGKEGKAPSVISMMINMGLKSGQVDPGQSLIGSEATHQLVAQLFLAIALICAPWMLFAKPLILKKQHQKHSLSFQYQEAAGMTEEIEMRDLRASAVEDVHRFDLEQQEVNRQRQYREFVEEEKDQSGESQLKNGKQEDAGHRTGHTVNQRSDMYNPDRQEDVRNSMDILIEIAGQKIESNHDGDFVFSEVFIHQLIETIEFVLGTISNTASYLRLWALSLAHSQLASVFYDNTIKTALEGGSIFGLMVAYTLWVSVTFFVLMTMDVMECFLHTLRLHWVEFQNKFYKGQGYRFTPFNFEGLFVNDK